MSGDTVTSRNALQFTNDNKYAYAFSGEVEQTSTTVDLLEFDTNSEYLIARISIAFGGSRNNDDFQANIIFNGVTVAEETYNNNYESASPQYFKMIIPPFTNVKVSVTKLVGTAGISTFAYVRAKVGMPQRVGN